MRSGFVEASPTFLRLVCGPALAVLALACSSKDKEEEEQSTPTTDLTYCDAKIVIEDKCLRCHTEGGDVLTPFFFETYAEVEERARSMKTAIERGSMPQTERNLVPEVEALTSAEKDLLVEWLGAGAPEGDGECE